MVLRWNNDVPEEELEQDLRAGLARVPAPADLKARIMARAGKTAGTQKKLVWIRRPMMLRAVAATLVAAIGLGIYAEHEHRQRLEGERAKEQVMLALRITGATLQTVQSRINSGHEMQEEEK